MLMINYNSVNIVVVVTVVVVVVVVVGSTACHLTTFVFFIKI